MTGMSVKHDDYRAVRTRTDCARTTAGCSIPRRTALGWQTQLTVHDPLGLT